MVVHIFVLAMLSDVKRQRKAHYIEFKKLRNAVTTMIHEEKASINSRSDRYKQQTIFGDGLAFQ